MEKPLTALEQKVLYVIEKNPHVTKSNTEMCIAFWEQVAEYRKVDKNNWERMRDIMREYPPETITRARRKIAPSSASQKKWEGNFTQQYR